MVRELGNIFWLPAHRAHTIFLFAYSALFAIPSFTREAQDRDPDRFSRNQLALTVRTTSSFILDAFGYDLRMNRPREVFWPAPVIKRAHAEQGQKKRISNAAMAYFAYHLITAAEYLAKDSPLPKFEKWCDLHFDFVGDFLRTAGYPFPQARPEAESFAVDSSLSGKGNADLWTNLPHVSNQLDVLMNSTQLGEFLLPNSSLIFKTIIGDCSQQC